jgi:hypothetical protein
MEGDAPADLKEKILLGLTPNEKPVWIGQPVPKLVLLRNSGYFAIAGVGILIGLIWLLVALAPARATVAPPPAPPVQQKAGKKGAPAPVPAPAPAPAQVQAGSTLPPLGVMLVSACFGLVPLVRWRNATRTCYLLTSRRALVLQQTLFGTTKESYSPQEVAAVQRSNSWLLGGHGDLIFRTVYVITTSRSRTGTSSSSVRTIHYGFLAVAQVGEVEKRLRETLIDRYVDKLMQANEL